jgi:hypothetical protein
MNAIKLQVVVPESRELKITLPPEILPGPAEVIVLVPEQKPQESNLDAILSLVEKWRKEHPSHRSKEEIDRYLAEERASWGDDE